ncbi:exodeoxyribonuclease V subunit gamma [Pigmentiphaga litoralis]|uniref:RecBCD enzyme subunit RecC n=1 Tax=Pigmentiphaga litoralis TaxID=516702 RepID=A0A7Y9IVL7_9BURK|nr:exodeoxyribonuclease V subunit gamma [Pigmentiphaga litoralis]NYE22514.1 exodeoxyribonuclease V gamma subunit [Pigmentiphaga litoralis]NYE83871.1 exodeoxyribonuclease V gamma subunit [Pigmentiphaga litoralis]
MNTSGKGGAANGASLAPGFMVVHSNRLEDLRSLAVSWMQRYPLAPLENEVILVQSNGIAQWLKLALAEDPAADDTASAPGAGGSSFSGGGHGCGIAAAIDVQLPASFLWTAYRAVLGRASIPESSPLDKASLTWRLMRLLPTLIHQESFAPLRRFLHDDAQMRKLHQLSERLADLFDQYQVYRADWLDDWAHGRDQLITSRKGVRVLQGQECWQPALWRALLEDVGAESMSQSRAGVHQRFMATLRTLERRPAGLPRRLMVFGISSMPAQALEALAALGKLCQVLLCVHNPSQHHWTDIVADQDLLRHQYQRQRRKPGMPAVIDADVLHRHGHPLLAAWGKQGRDYIHLLDSFDAPDQYREAFADVSDRRIDLFTEQPADTLLTQLHDDVLQLRAMEETRDTWPPVDLDADTSIRFHVAHGPQREVEILHDQLLARFSADPTLRPRDVIVMVPAIDTYAPHIQAVFGQIDHTDDRHIPFTLADQGQRGREPLLIAVEHLLRLPESRFAVSDVLDLLDVPALRHRFGIKESDLPTLHRWIQGAGIRWGLDAAQRASLDLPGGMEQNTWRFGLRRMLLGYAVGQGDSFDGIEPYDEIGGLDAALIGPLAGLLDALDTTRDQLAIDADPMIWVARLRTMLARFFLADDDRDVVQLGRLEQLLEDWETTCDSVGLTEPLPLTVVREAWLQALDQGRLNQRFLAGAVNFCTLMPMRAIPFRVVCLLGMNDGDYPRAQPPLDFDLMGGDYRPGDRSRREDDRYLLLEAVLSAREQLYISWVGRSIRDNSERPPSVLVGQLRDHLAAGWQTVDDSDLLDGLTVVHPLQPFSARYFLPSSGSDDAGAGGGQAGGVVAGGVASASSLAGNRGLFSYAREWAVLHGGGDDISDDLGDGQGAAGFGSGFGPGPASRPDSGAGASLHLTTASANASTAPTAWTPPDAIDVAELQQFLRDPLRTFFNQRLKVFFDDDTPEAVDDEPFALDPLQRYALSDSLLQAGMAATTHDEAEDALARRATQLRRSGVLPMAGFGEKQQAGLLVPLPDLLARYRQARSAWPVEVASPWPIDFHHGKVRVEGWLGGLRQADGDSGRHAVLTAVPNGLLASARALKWHRLTRLWVTHLAGNASGLDLTSIVVASDVTLTFEPVPPVYAAQVLNELVDGWLAGMAEPLPVALRSAFVWLANVEAGQATGARTGASHDDAAAASMHAKAYDEARKVYEGGFNTTGEMAQNPYLARHYPSAEALFADGRFAHWAERLYRPLFEAGTAALETAVKAKAPE